MDNESGPFRKSQIPPNSPAPVELENEHFKGTAMLIHDTGNEPGLDEQAQKAIDPASRRGVELQIQGVFKHKCTVGEQTAGLWVGGELQEPLKLGWIMNNVVQLCAKYARKKTEGRFQFNLGGKGEKPFLGFPVGQLFTIVITPAGQKPPPIGGEELRNKKWQGAGPFDVDTSSTYTLVYRTPYLDLCSWDLLKVPGVSPLPLENILGDIQSLTVFIYDLGVAGSHSNFRSAPIFEFFFSRGSPGDAWVEEEEVVPVTLSRPLDEESDSEAGSAADSGEGSVEARSEDEQTVVEAAGEDSDSSTDSSLVEDEEEDEALSRADSQALIEIEGWRPRNFSVTSLSTNVRVPFYIEAIDRRRRRKICIWYVFAMRGQEDASTEEYWHAKAASDLASMCRPRRRLRTFRRGPGARRYTTYAVRTLEQFRSIVMEHLDKETTLRNNVMDMGASVDTSSLPGMSANDAPQVEGRPPASDVAFQERPSETQSRRAKLAAPAKKMARKVRRRNRGPLVPPRFFVRGGSTTCGLAFAHAREGRTNVFREALVGAVHFEGRLCEELMRVSTDGVVRCFTPYDCDKPRVRLLGKEVLLVEKIEGLFLGRFYQFQVHTLLRVFLFCTSDVQERDEWIEILTMCREPERLKNWKPAPPEKAGPEEAEEFAGEQIEVQKRRRKRDILKEKGLEVVSLANTVVTTAGAAGATVAARASGLKGGKNTSVAADSALPAFMEPLSDIAAFLVDISRARRWRQKKRLILNDRVILPNEAAPPPPPSIIEEMLVAALSLPEKPPVNDIVAFMTSTCALKAVRFKGWSQNELLAFWINTYHCLIVHGCLVLGTPSNRQEMLNFHKRVSYLVGLRPVSLREIERIILQVPRAEAQQVVRARARARAVQFLGCCGLFFRQPEDETGQKQKDRDSPPRSPTAAKGQVDSEGGKQSSPPSPSSSSTTSGRVKQKKQKAKNMCMPKVPLPQAPWKLYDTHACLFLGLPPEGTNHLPRQDLRVALALNRGHHICLPSIPVLDAPRLNSELNDISQSYIANFVQVEKKEGRPYRLTFPHSLQGVKRELKEDQHAFLKFIGSFMPMEPQVSTTVGVQIKFSKQPETPRRRVELIRMTYSDANLNVASARQALGKEFEVINATAQALSRLQAGLEAQEQADITDMPDEELEWADDVKADITASPDGKPHLWSL